MYHVLPDRLQGSCGDAAVEQSTLIVEQSTLIVEQSTLIFEQIKLVVEQSALIVEQSTLIVEQSILSVEPSVQFATSRCLAYLMQELASFQLVGGIRKQVLIVSDFVAGPSAVVDKFLVLELQLIVVLGQLLVRRLQTGQLQHREQAFSALLGTQDCDQMCARKAVPENVLGDTTQ